MLQIYKWAQPPIEELASRVRKLGVFFTDLSAYDSAVQLFDELVLIDKRIYGVVHSKVFIHLFFFVIISISVVFAAQELILSQVAEDLQYQVHVNLKMAKYDTAESLAEQVLGTNTTKQTKEQTKIIIVHLTSLMQSCTRRYTEEITPNVQRT